MDDDNKASSDTKISGELSRRRREIRRNHVETVPETGGIHGPQAEAWGE